VVTMLYDILSCKRKHNNLTNGEKETKIDLLFNQND
jgi:hypothetical protein